MGIFNKVKENKKFEPRNTRETLGKHLGNTQETPGIKGAGLEKKTSLPILLGILNKEKEKNNALENT